MGLPLAPDMAVPDLVEPVIGFRQWRLRDGHLYSLITDDEWNRGALAAQCRNPAHPTSDHSGPPSERCSCGIYAYYRPLPRTASVMWAELVTGAVAVWGQLQAHATGLRAQHAQAVVFALPIERGRKRRELLTFAEDAGIDVAPARLLRRAALAHGGLLPDQLKPPTRIIGVAAAPR